MPAVGDAFERVLAAVLEDEPGSGSVLSTMFGLIWLGFTLVLAFQVWMVGRRFWAAVSAR